MQFFNVLFFLLCYNILYSSELKAVNLKINNSILNQIVNVSKKGNRRLMLSEESIQFGEYPNRTTLSSEVSSDVTSSAEKMKWKDEWQQVWLEKKLEALNSSGPAGDMVNMVAARPWGVSCGDPEQYDKPWGTCVLPMECEAEYRIYRGDYLCGRTRYVCCSLQLTNYDLYGGFDISFEATSLETDSEEKTYRDKEESKADRKRRRERERRKRQKERVKRKKRIKKVIKRIVKEIHKILIRQYRNTTQERKRKTSQLKRFIKALKKRYLQDRRIVKDIHGQELIKLDHSLQKRLMEIHDMNERFRKNETFRDIVVNGTMSRHQLRTLLTQYPELREERPPRRGGGGILDNLEYDVEYGYIYN